MLNWFRNKFGLGKETSTESMMNEANRLSTSKTEFASSSLSSVRMWIDGETIYLDFSQAPDCYHYFSPAHDPSNSHKSFAEARERTDELIEHIISRLKLKEDWFKNGYIKKATNETLFIVFEPPKKRQNVFNPELIEKITEQTKDFDSNSKLSAIKVIAESNNLSLKDAKDIVEVIFDSR